MKFYTHDTYLIERTKLLEGFLCQSLTFTNAKGKQWGEGNINTPSSALTFFQHKDPSANLPSSYDDRIKNAVKDLYLTPVKARTEFIVLRASGDIGLAVDNCLNEIFGEGKFTTVSPESSTTYITPEGSYTLAGNQSATIMLSTQVSIRYNLTVRSTIDSSVGAIVVSDEFEIHYIIAGVESQYPLKPYTITDCVNRVLELAEPLQKGDTPRFKLQGVNYDENGNRLYPYESGSQAEKFDKIIAPNFTMTQCTLREQLKVIGGYIHGEPRLGYSSDGKGVNFEENTVVFDLYGKDEQSTLQEQGYIYKGIAQSINQYCTSVTTNASNLVNSLNYAQGVVFEPNGTNYKTVRTDTVNIKLTESNVKFTTKLPVYQPIKLECGMYYAQDKQSELGEWAIEPVDITPYLFEAHEYNSVLESYSGTYPYSKTFAIYYTQGGNDIEGLFFKAQDNVIDDYLNKYAIVNILEAVTGRTDISGLFDGKWYDDDNDVTKYTGFPYLCFRLSYIPIYSAKFSHSKPQIVEGNYPFTAIYGQGENLVETTYYGENIKGVAARLGNVEKTLTFKLPSMKYVPKTGQKMGDYHISAVYWSFNHNYIKCTVGLTKKFNRLSQHVGINSTKRISEISERECYDRDVLINEYVIIGDETSLPSATYLRTAEPLKSLFYGEYVNSAPINAVICGSKIKSYTGDYVGKVALPVMSSAFGNVMSFSWKYKDNYSAGTSIQRINATSGGENTFAWWQTDIPYSNYYGRAYWHDFSLVNDFANGGLAFANNPMENVPDPDKLDTLITPTICSTFRVEAENATPYLLRKDS